MPVLSPEYSSIFRRMISLTLDNWHSFQLAVDAGMGGSQTHDKLAWIVEVIEELFTQNSDPLLPSDVEDFLSEIIDNEFETVIQDGSLETVCSSLCSAFQQISSGNTGAVNERIEILSRKSQIAKQQREDAKKNKLQVQNNDDDEEEDMEIEEQSIVHSDRKKVEKECEQNDEEEEEEGWTKVRNTRRH